MDWNALLNKQIQPPFQPNVSEEGWLNNFDKDFTGMSKKKQNNSITISF